MILFSIKSLKSISNKKSMKLKVLYFQLKLYSLKINKLNNFQKKTKKEYIYLYKEILQWMKKVA